MRNSSELFRDEEKELFDCNLRKRSKAHENSESFPHILPISKSGDMTSR